MLGVLGGEGELFVSVLFCGGEMEEEGNEDWRESIIESETGIIFISPFNSAYDTRGLTYKIDCGL